MSRTYCIPGVVFLAIAFILSFLVSISLPSLHPLDIIRVKVTAGISDFNFGEIRFGIWSACTYFNEKLDECLPAQHGYSIPLDGIKSSWTQGLVVHPIATGFTFIALVLSFSTHLTMTLAASLMSFVAALFTLIAFAIDIAFLLLTRHQINNLASQLSTGDIDATKFIQTTTAPAFWMTFVSLIFLLLAGCTVCFGRRQSRANGDSNGQSYPLYENKGGIFSRFRK